MSGLTQYGAFVDLGGLDGLIHISELDWAYTEHPRQVVNVGDELQVLVVSVDRRRERVGLSLKRLQPNPWDRVTENLFPGDRLVGTVTGLVPFGAFVDVGAGVEGLLHVSKIPQGQRAWSELEPGSQIDLRIVSIDRQRQRIALAAIDGFGGQWQPG